MKAKHILWSMLLLVPLFYFLGKKISLPKPAQEIMPTVKEETGHGLLEDAAEHLFSGHELETKSAAEFCLKGCFYALMAGQEAKQEEEKEKQPDFSKLKFYPDTTVHSIGKQH